MESKNKNDKAKDPKTETLDFGPFGSAKVKNLEINDNAHVYALKMISLEID